MQQTVGLRRALAADLGQGSAAWAMQRFAERLPAEFPAFGLEPRRDLEFKWADYLRAHWAQTGISTKDIDTNFDSATNAALVWRPRRTRLVFLAIPGRCHAIEDITTLSLIGVREEDRLFGNRSSAH